MKTFSLGELLKTEFPPEEHIIGDGVFKKGSKLFVVAPPKSYKSFAVNTVVFQLLTGGNMFNVHSTRSSIPRPYFQINPVEKVLILEQELGLMDNKERLQPYYDHLTEEQKALVSDRLFLRSCDLDLNFHTEVGVKKLYDAISEIKPAVVIFDPFIKFHGVLENDATEMNKVMMNISKLQQNMGFSSIFIHHCSKTEEREGLDKIRGASAIAGDLDTCLLLTVANRASSVVEVETILKRGRPVAPYYIQLNRDTLKMEFSRWKKGSDKVSFEDSLSIQ